MKLTGKCKEDFEKWFEPPLKENEKDPWGIALYGSMVAEFYSLTESMQYGVYVDFFDSVGIKISIRNISDAYWFVINNVNTEGKKDRYEGRYMSRPEARTKAIEKANEIYNKI